MKVDLHNYEAIIFDFGGVILDIDFQKMMDALTELSSAADVKKIQTSGILEKIECGQINGEEFFTGVQDILHKKLDKEKFLAAWNAILLDYKPRRIEVLHELKQTHKLFLLSNTNEIHYKTFSKKLWDEYKITFDDLFEKTYLSHEMGMIKPDKNIYQQVLDEQNLVPEKTLFIEDTEINARAAETLGIQTLLIPRNGSFYHFFV